MNVKDIESSIQKKNFDFKRKNLFETEAFFTRIIMIIPVRCFSCGKEIASKWESYQRMQKEGKPIAEIWETLGITRFCCKRMIVSHVNLVDDILQFPRLQ